MFARTLTSFIERNVFHGESVLTDMLDILNEANFFLIKFKLILI
jgi:hypothetical protein